MRHPVTPALLFLLLASGIATASGTDVEFSTPAQFQGVQTSSDWTWVAATFEGSPLTANGTIGVNSRLWDYEMEYLLVDTETGPGTWVETPLGGDSHATPVERTGGFSLQEQPRIWNTILLHGHNITTTLEGAKTNLDVFRRDCDDWTGSSQQSEERGFHEPLCPGAATITQVGRFHSEPPTLTISADSLDWIEWHALQVHCEGVSPCPGPAMTERTTVSPNGIDKVEYKVHHWTRVEQVTGFQLSGRPTELFTFGDDTMIQIDGQIRLPHADVRGCDGCFDVKGSTMTAQGAFLFHGLTPAGEERISAQISGDATWLREDEADVDPQRILGAGAAVAGGTAFIGLLSAIKFLSPLFTRISGDKALEHPRRQALYGYIVENPGATFREVVRETDIPAGTARHHLTILRRSGLLAEHRHRSTLRFFENHGRYDQTWGAVVLRREEDLRVLHDWVLDHPGASQKEILSAMADLGWSRSTTQHRLNRLEAGGLISVRPSGRCKIYEAHATPRQDPGRDHWDGLGGSDYTG